MRFDLPWNSSREPVMGRRLVATSQPLAAQAGLRMLDAGGSAIDAAIATAAALTVVEPTSNGLGSDAFAIWWDGERLHGLNASGRAPMGLDTDRIWEAGRIPRLGWDAVTVPGAVSGWAKLHEAQGVLPFATLLKPAIEYARNGFALSPQTARSWARAIDRYRSFPDWMATFAPEGHAPAPGTIVRLRDHARTLQAIAETKGRDFYEGEIAQAIDTAARAAQGSLRREDLEAHTALKVTPLCVPFGEVELHELPPNGQGLAALIAAGVLDRHVSPEAQALDPLQLHLQIEAMKIGFAHGGRHIGDPDRLTLDPSSLLSPEALDADAGRLDPRRAQDICDAVPQWSSTVYLACGDEQGRAVSFIQSNFEGFGSGIVVPGTGITMQNRGAGFVLEAGHPNTLQAGVRPYHTIIPGFTTRGDQVDMAMGVMGGPMQPQGHLQVLDRIRRGWNPQAALDAPRWRFEGGLRVSVEPQMPDAVVESLRSMGHKVHVAKARDVSFGGGQIAMRHAGAWMGASDCRRDGQAVVS
ncbi:MAG: gamma-glutamyltransferase family protein [Phycisphaerales bacterium]|nr:gamma-glutamyltransferase family protein [Phycisphaerales bacterium]